METIVLASESPQRREYLRLLGLPFISMPANINETLDKSEHADGRTVAAELAVRKVKKVLKDLKEPSPLWICGADTLISFGGKIYGKPRDREDAARTLRAFQNHTHEVISAVALYNGRTKTTDCRTAATSVTFAPLTNEEIELYLDSGEWQGAAGSYRIQGLASCFITGINGSYSSVVGLPLREFYVILRDNDYPFGG